MQLLQIQTNYLIIHILLLRLSIILLQQSFGFLRPINFLQKMDLHFISILVHCFVSIFIIDLAFCNCIKYYHPTKAYASNFTTKIFCEIFLDRHLVWRSLDPTLDIWSNFVKKRRHLPPFLKKYTTFYNSHLFVCIIFTFRL